LVFVVIVVALVGFSEFQAWRIAREFPPAGRFVDLDHGRLHVTERLPTGPFRGTWFCFMERAAIKSI
jgi:hypothetical protein